MAENRPIGPATSMAEALPWLTAAVKLAPDEPLYHYHLGKLLAEGRDGLRIDRYRRRWPQLLRRSCSAWLLLPRTVVHRDHELLARPEACIDVDKVEDHAIASAILAERIPHPATFPG